MQIGGDCNRNESEGGDHKAALRQKKLKAKTLKWRSSNEDMNSNVQAGGSDGVYDDTVLCSLTTASFNNLMSTKRARTLGKVAEQCDAIDPPVPRRLRSAINKRVRHVKKRRHLSAISAQISFVDQRTRFNETSLLTEEEEVADALLSLSQIPSTREFTANKVIIAADSMKVNVSSTSYSEGGTKKGDILPNAANELSNQAASNVKRVPRVNPVPGDRNQPNNINPPFLEHARIKDHSSGVVANLPSQCKDSSNNSARKQLKVQLDDSKNYPAPKPEACCLVDSNKSDKLMREYGKVKNGMAQETIHRAQTQPPCTPDGYLIKPSSTKLAVEAKTVSEFSRVTASRKLPLVNTSAPSKTWKRSITHVYVSHLIQMHLNTEKASSHRQVKPEEKPRIHASSRSSPNDPSSALHAQQDAAACYAVHLDVLRGPVHQPPAAAGQQKMVGGGGVSSFMLLPGAQAQQHVPYLHPQIAPRGSMPGYPFPHLPQDRADLATLQQMQQYMCNPGLMPANANSAAMMKLHQQMMPTQQQQMWQFHVAHQYQARPSDAAAAWHNMPSSLRPTTMSMLSPTTAASPAVPPQMELLCAPYQGGGSSRQLRLM